MKYQMFFFCSCDYQVALTDGDEKTILQCDRCYTLSSKESARFYAIKCRACGHMEELREDVVFGASKSCERCALNGTVAFEEEDTIALFDLKSHIKPIEPCQKCKNNTWFDGEPDGFTCPLCRRERLKQKMSDSWSE